jgi:hypothetical protein
MCLSPCGRRGQSHFRGLRRENRDSPRERLQMRRRSLTLGEGWIAHYTAEGWERVAGYAGGVHRPLFQGDALCRGCHDEHCLPPA